MEVDQLEPASAPAATATPAAAASVPATEAPAAEVPAAEAPAAEAAAKEAVVASGGGGREPTQMEQKYAEAAAKDGLNHVAQFEPNDGATTEDLSVMSQVPEVRRVRRGFPPRAAHACVLLECRGQPAAITCSPPSVR